MTADQYLALGETAERYELVDGVVLMSPSPAYKHQKLIMLLVRQLDRHVEAVGGELLTEIDVALSPSLVYKPDLVYFRPGKLDVRSDRIAVAPDLIIEVLSPSSKSLDLITKRGDYERFGVGEYWVLDPDTLQVRRWVRRGQKLEEMPVSGDSLAGEAISGFNLDLRPLRRL